MTEVLKPTGDVDAVSYEMPERPEQFQGEVDLASRWLGGSVLAASDESFGEKESLLIPTSANFVPGRYSHRGEIVDGWETRRRRDEGHDWAVVRLGAAGAISRIDVDTSFFTGNFPTTCRIEACGTEGYPSSTELNGNETEWVEIVPRSPLAGDTHNFFKVISKQRFTHIRLSAFPDGGIARLRVYGRVIPDPRAFDGLTIDLASQHHGGRIVSSSDGFYSSASVLNRPDSARTMGDGWETRRRRDDGNDYAVVRLAFSGTIRAVELDTAHFKYNASAGFSLSAVNCSDIDLDVSQSWMPILPHHRLQPDTRHLFRIPDPGWICSHVRLDAFPDGGISRLRLWGQVDALSRATAGFEWFNSLPGSQAMAVLRQHELLPVSWTRR